MRWTDQSPYERILAKDAAFNGRVATGEDADLVRLEAVMAHAVAVPEGYSNVETLAERVGVGVSKLKALFRDHAHLQPAAFLQRVRIQKACILLGEGQGDLADLAAHLGYASASGFHEAFRRQTGLSPGTYRGMLRSDHFALPQPPGLRVADVLAFHGRDAESVSERVDGSCLHKAFLCEGHPSVLSLAFDGHEVSVALSGASGSGAMARAHIGALRLLGWQGDPAAFEAAHPELVQGREGLRVLLTLDPFEALVWAILGQQVNLAFAYAMRRDLIRLAGVPAAEGLIAHPDAEAIAALTLAELQALRFSRRKAEYLLHAASQVALGSLRLEEQVTATGAARALVALRGCGPWTAQYVLMRGLGLGDCVPVGDAGLTLALQRRFGLEQRPDVPETLRLMSDFKPHRSLATFHLWSSLKGLPS